MDEVAVVGRFRLPACEELDGEDIFSFSLLSSPVFFCVFSEKRERDEWVSGPESGTGFG